jgi:hypothetical protein
MAMDGAIMKLLTTVSGSYLTGTDLADAVISYGLALTRAHAVDVVSIPFLRNDGSTRTVDFTVGWELGTAAISADGIADGFTVELIDSEALSMIQDRTAALVGSRNQALEHGEIGSTDLGTIDWPSWVDLA